MKDYLLGAQASIDWSVSKLPEFEFRLKTWLDENIEIAFVETPAPATHDPIVAREKGDLPLAFTVEAGAYINAVRSSLDILACAIGKQEMVLDPDDIYFPVAESAEDFARGNYRGLKFVRQLSRASREIIESFKPYQGGNEILWACHKLDITRKHKRLLETYIRPARSHVTGWGLSQSFTPVATGFMPAGNGETVLGLLRKGAPQPKVKYTALVCFNEAAAALPGRPVIGAITQFASVAAEIVRAFDEVGGRAHAQPR